MQTLDYLCNSKFYVYTSNYELFALHTWLEWINEQGCKSGHLIKPVNDQIVQKLNVHIGNF